MAATVPPRDRAVHSTVGIAAVAIDSNVFCEILLYADARTLRAAEATAKVFYTIIHSRGIWRRLFLANGWPPAPACLRTASDDVEEPQHAAAHAARCLRLSTPLKPQEQWTFFGNGWKRAVHFYQSELTAKQTVVRQAGSMRWTLRVPPDRRKRTSYIHLGWPVTLDERDILGATVAPEPAQEAIGILGPPGPDSPRTLQYPGMRWGVEAQRASSPTPAMPHGMIALYLRPLDEASVYAFISAALVNNPALSPEQLQAFGDLRIMDRDYCTNTVGIPLSFPDSAVAPGEDAVIVLDITILPLLQVDIHFACRRQLLVVPGPLPTPPARRCRVLGGPAGDGRPRGPSQPSALLWETIRVPALALLSLSHDTDPWEPNDPGVWVLHDSEADPSADPGGRWQRFSPVAVRLTTWLHVSGDDPDNFDSLWLVSSMKMACPVTPADPQLPTAQAVVFSLRITDRHGQTEELGSVGALQDYFGICKIPIERLRDAGTVVDIGCALLADAAQAVHLTLAIASGTAVLADKCVPTAGGRGSVPGGGASVSASAPGLGASLRSASDDGGPREATGAAGAPGSPRPSPSPSPSSASSSPERRRLRPSSALPAESPSAVRPSPQPARRRRPSPGGYFTWQRGHAPATEAWRQYRETGRVAGTLWGADALCTPGAKRSAARSLGAFYSSIPQRDREVLQQWCVTALTELMAAEPFFAWNIAGAMWALCDTTSFAGSEAQLLAAVDAAGAHLVEVSRQVRDALLAARAAAAIQQRMAVGADPVAVVGAAVDTAQRAWIAATERSERCTAAEDACNAAKMVSGVLSNLSLDRRVLRRISATEGLVSAVVYLAAEQGARECHFSCVTILAMLRLADLLGPGDVEALRGVLEALCTPPHRILHISTTLRDVADYFVPLVLSQHIECVRLGSWFLGLVYHKLPWSATGHATI
eukprot:TRINITY_DN60212_c0_g1_i1.p1 TRINITY_DN60212_c0_g1~~TRINITY_DN60212_c0_g1_i1.p1  ORF type:complete len:935 (+),score=224.23 TRINITY_DN60212_c0_g1_i1:86-2890(+)